MTNNFTITDSITHNTLKIDDAECIYVEINGKTQLVIDPSQGSIQIRVYPRTAGELWDMPFDTLDIDGAEIAALENDMLAGNSDIRAGKSVTTGLRKV